MPTFIQGFLASLTLDGTDITLTVESFDYSESRTSLDKSVMDGTGESQSIPGKKSGQLSITGHISQSDWNGIQVSAAKTEALAFQFSPVEATAATNFSYGGLITLSDIGVSVSASGNWGFSLSGDTFDVSYTPYVAA